MPSYRVVSGDFDTKIRRLSPQQAATDAIGTLKTEIGFNSVRLGMMTIVTLDVEGEEDEDPLYISTLTLVQQNGLNYRETE